MNNSISQSEFLNKSKNTILSDSGSIMISQLKTKIFELEQNEKSYSQLYSRCKSIQLENNLLTEKSIQLEYQLRQKTDSMSKMIKDINAQNAGLKEELNQKMITNKKLFNANTTLTQAIEVKNNAIEEMKQMMNENEKKNKELVDIANNSTQEKQRIIEEIKPLKNEIASLNKVIKAKDDLIKEKENKHSSNETKLNNVIQRIKDEISNANNTLTKEMKEKKDCESEIEQMKSQLIEKTNEVNQLKMGNEDDNKSFIQISLERDKLLNDIDKYKSHIMILTKANQELINELEEVARNEDQLNSLLQRDDDFFLLVNGYFQGNTNAITNNITPMQSIGKHYAQTSPIQQKNGSFG